ncbi:MAG: hypothetical protein IPM56_06435 [Ignavibacteriales bacterium]|nr:MAG: hypothetical protein IPM56_06435 [Ignavibacteriales bacterium]
MIVPNSFEKILDISIYLSKLTRKVSCSRKASECSIFFQKNILSAYTVFTIYNPKPVISLPALSVGAVFQDFPSAFVIVRSMFESYINMCYLLFDSVSEEEIEHRLDLWEKHGLVEQNILLKYRNVHKEKINENLSDIEEIRSKILKSKHFINLSDSDKQSISYSDKWTRLNKMQLAEKAEISLSLSQFIYKFLSNYTHSEAFSLMQIKSVSSFDESVQLSTLPKLFAEMILALTLCKFTKLNLFDKKILTKDKEIIRIIRYWSITSKKEFEDFVSVK